MTITVSTLTRLIGEAEVARDRAATPALRRAFAQLAAGYALGLRDKAGALRDETGRALRQSACAAAQPLAHAHWKL